MFPKFIDVPFAKDMATAIVYGIEMPDGRRIFKTWTVRYKAVGRPGDFFDTNFHCFVITRIFRASLEEVARNYEKMGFSSREEFEDRWKKVHLDRGFKSEDYVWVHEFKPKTNAIIERFEEYNESEEI